MYNRKRHTPDFYSYFFRSVRSHAIKILKSASLYKTTNMFVVTFAILSAKYRC